MRSERRRALGVALGMAAVAVGARQLLPTHYLSDTRPAFKLEELFPPNFADWRVDTSLPIILPSPDVQAKLDQLYSQLLTRTYVNAAHDRVMLSVAYGRDQSDTAQVHRPEICYPSQGFLLLSSHDATLTIDRQPLPVRRLETRMGGRIEPVTYWVVVGNRAAVNRAQQKLAQLSFVVHGLIPDGMLVRVSSIDTDTDHAFLVQRQFLTALKGAMGAAAAERVFGRPT